MQSAGLIRMSPNTSVSFILLGFLLLLSTPVFAKEMNQAAPDFTLKSMAGDNLKLSEQAGTVVMVNFWASWCGPCRTEMPLLNDLYLKYKDLGFTIFGVNVEQDTALARSFINKQPVDFPILFDASNTVSKAYNVVAMPSTVLIDRDGNMRYLHQGYQAGDEKKYKNIVRKLLRE